MLVPVSVSREDLYYSRDRIRFLQDHGRRPVVIYVPRYSSWWRPGCMGRTYQHEAAGVFSLKSAFERSRTSEDDIIYQFID